MPSTISCPRCGHSFDGSQEPESVIGRIAADALTLRMQQEGDVATIQEEVHRLDATIKKLNQERARLLQIVNNIQATTRYLPLEVLSTIFQFARPPIDFETRPTPSGSRQGQEDLWRLTREKEDDFQLVLGAVSHHWRQIVWATPQLWTTISIELYEMDGENNVSLLNLYFENSRSLPMTIEFDFGAQLVLMTDGADSEGQERELFMKSLEVLLLNNAVKIKTFIAVGLPIEWISLISKGFSRCESMKLYWPSAYNMRSRNDTHLLDLTQLPSLHHLRMHNFCFPFNLPWSAITILQLGGVPTERCIESLVNCPNLVAFGNDFYHGPPGNSSVSLNHPVVLEHLEYLSWSAQDGPWSLAFLRNIRFSKLSLLKWTGLPLLEQVSEEHHNDLVAFFSSLPGTLQVLELNCVWYGYRIMKPLLASIPCLKELILTNCSETTLSMAMSMIGRPASGLTEDVERRAVVDPNQFEGPKVLSRLRKLKGTYIYSELKPVMHVEMLEALHGARVMQEHFLLELIGVGDVWRPEILARLKRLAESGFEFEILINSLSLDYS